MKSACRHSKHLESGFKCSSNLNSWARRSKDLNSGFKSSEYLISLGYRCCRHLNATFIYTERDVSLSRALYRSYFVFCLLKIYSNRPFFLNALRTKGKNSLDISFSSHVEKAIRAIWLAVGFLDQLVNQIYFALFQSVNLSTYIINTAVC